jgi:transposase
LSLEQQAPAATLSHHALGKRRRHRRTARLEDGIFRWPKMEDGVMRLSAAQLSALLEGLDWRRVHEARETATPTQAG